MTLQNNSSKPVAATKSFFTSPRMQLWVARKRDISLTSLDSSGFLEIFPEILEGCGMENFRFKLLLPLLKSNYFHNYFYYQNLITQIDKRKRNSHWTQMTSCSKQSHSWCWPWCSSVHPVWPGCWQTCQMSKSTFWRQTRPLYSSVGRSHSGTSLPLLSFLTEKNWIGTYF